jgi:long-chain acyl-CoA synthetase
LVARHCEVQMTGVPLVEGYGLTETAPVAIANPVTIEEWSGEIGVPLPSTDAAILDDDGRPVALGEVGEIRLRGLQVMKGYWNRPEETAKVFTAEGWLRTGEAVKVVVLRKDPALTEAEVLAHCRQHLTGYKVPSIVEFRDEPLPAERTHRPPPSARRSSTSRVSMSLSIVAGCR